MSAISKRVKLILLGSAALLAVGVLALLLVHRPSDTWTCQWLDTPTLQRGTPRNQCHGVVQCRHPTMQTFVPQIRKVTCPTRGDACDAAACFTPAEAPDSATIPRSGHS
jgi:hypothetical protein